MSWRVRYYVDVDWVGEGTGGVGQGILEANNPAAGGVGMAQTLRLQGAQYVAGVASSVPTAASFTSTFSSMASDISTQFMATSLTTAQNWSTGSP